MKKKVIALILALALMLTLNSVAFAADAASNLTMETSETTAVDDGSSFTVTVKNKAATLNVLTFHVEFPAEDLTVKSVSWKYGTTDISAEKLEKGTTVVGHGASTVSEANGSGKVGFYYMDVAASGSGKAYAAGAFQAVITFEVNKVHASGQARYSVNSAAISLHEDSDGADGTNGSIDGPKSAVSFSHKVYAPLSITTQPANVSVAKDSTATFKVAATGASSYQWQYRTSSTGTWNNCSSATKGYNAATLQPVGTSGRNGYQYRCVVKDAAGNTVTSNAATLKVLYITTQPANVSGAKVSTATFKVAAKNASSYQWQYRTSSTGTWNNCSSATKGYNTATLQPVGTSGRNGYQYRCVVKDAAGNTVTSNAATLTVKVGAGGISSSKTG